jgi:hypothetical protein
MGHKDRRIMGIDLSDNYIVVKILTHVDVTFFTQNSQWITTQSLADVSWVTLCVQQSWWVWVWVEADDEVFGNLCELVIGGNGILISLKLKTVI